MCACLMFFALAVSLLFGFACRVYTTGREQGEMAYCITKNKNVSKRRRMSYQKETLKKEPRKEMEEIKSRK